MRLSKTFLLCLQLSWKELVAESTIELADDFQKLIFSPTFQQVTLSNSPLRKVTFKFCKVEIGGD